ncbi:MAG: MFS transporter, partial [Burkholderiaceae bacterium]
LAIITGQMLGSSVAGVANDIFGWRSSLGLAALAGLAAALLAWTLMPAAQLVRRAPGTPRVSFMALYGRVFENPKALWLYAAVILEATFVFGAFPYVGQFLIDHAGSTASAAPRQAGLVLGAFSVGGLMYALSVRRLIALLGVRRMCVIGSIGVALAYLSLTGVQLWWLAALAMIFAGASYYMLHNSLQTEATEIAPTARGSAVALFACGFFVGQGLGPVLFGALVLSWGFPAALLTCAVGVVGLGQAVVRKVILPH